MSDPVAMIIEALSPYIGAQMSSAVVNNELINMGASRERITRGELDRLVKTLALGLSVFVGKAKSTIIAAELQRKLSMGPGGPADTPAYKRVTE